MRELNHVQHTYEGNPCEQVTVTVTANGTVHMVTFRLDGGPVETLPEDTPIQFNLKNASGDLTPLQLVMDFSGPGSYDIVVRTVTNCPTDPLHMSCTHSRNGSADPIIENQRYFVE
jgi:hypothetical protein